MATKNTTFRCIATGDAMITKRLPQGGNYEGFDEVRDFIMQGDFRFIPATDAGSLMNMWQRRGRSELYARSWILSQKLLRSGAMNGAITPPMLMNT